jgi:penicillin amidase
MDSDALAPHVFVQLVLACAQAIGGDDAQRGGLETSPINATEIVRLLAGGLDEDWWDDVRTGPREGRDEIIKRVLDELDGRHLNERWGDAHSVRFDHPFKQIPVLGRLFGQSWSRGPFAVPGGNATVNAHYWRTDSLFDVVAIPTARFVADVGDWDRSVLVLPLGQSGRPWSPHYSDQLRSWLGVEAIEFPFSAEAVEAATVSRLTLVPAVENDE